MTPPTTELRNELTGSAGALASPPPLPGAGADPDAGPDMRRPRGPLRARVQLWQGYLAFGALGMFFYLLIPPLKGNPVLLNSIGMTSWIAVIVGIRRNRPSYSLPWLLFALGFFLYWLGDVYTYSYPQLILHGEVPFPSIGDAIYLTVYPAQMLGLLLLVRRRNPRRNRNTLIDAAILTLGLSLLSWVLQIAPYLHDPSMGLLPKLVSVAYPLGDIMLLAAAIRLVLDSGRRRPAFYLLSASLVSLLATDFTYGILTLEGAFHHQLILDLGWTSYQLLWAAAALHPSMVALQEPVSDRGGAKLTPLRLSLLTGASLIAPVCILLKELRRGDLDLIVIICASVVLFGLVVMRMVDLVHQQERSVARERTFAEEKARLMAEIQRRSSEARFASLVQHASDLITVVGEDATITYQSPSSERVLGYPPDELLGTRFDRLVVPEDAGRLLRLLGDGAAYPRRDGKVIECTLRHRDGSLRQFEILHTNLLADEHVQGIVLNARDISERKVFEEQLAHQAFHDPVTNLPNRALFVERVRHAIGRARREGSGLGVVFLDIDDFKTINDSLGHGAGDAALMDVAKRLANSIRSSDTAARFGGDEFVVLLEDLDGTGTAAEVAERILEDLRQPLMVAGKELVVRGSIGISILDESSSAGADELIRDADAAMYIAKRDGKGSYRLFEPEMHAGVLARLELRADLQRALENGQFELYYQPIVRLADGQVVGMEALLRWRHPDRGLVVPGEFIPFAEETGLIVPIGRWVLREACRQARELQRLWSGEPHLYMCVNLSVKQLQHSDVISDVQDALAESGLQPHLLTLEITESMLIDDPDIAVVKLAELRALGLRIAMDDFGTGYSSLSYLSRFPVDVIKMDRSFLRPEATREAVDLSSAVVALGSSLALEVVAEGIELDEQWQRLRELGCELGQGFHFARPMESAHMLDYLAGGAAPAAEEPGRLMSVAPPDVGEPGRLMSVAPPDVGEPGRPVSAAPPDAA
ncbi:MAG TPA: EAL domain-containing protein [Solirubrobacteraceae bacterium]|nr:EAL domain-containing protein [Solirubrobacteraceae bacterium]